MKQAITLLVCLLLSGCVIVQKTPKTTVSVVEEASRNPITAIVERKYYATEDFSTIGRTDAQGIIAIPATYRPMPIPHLKLPVRMLLRVSAEGYESEEFEIWGTKKDVEIVLKKEK